MSSRLPLTANYMRFVAPLMVFLGTSGCIVTPPHRGLGVIRNEDVGFFEQGRTTRAEVLLRLGDPDSGDERFFVYHWRRTVGYWFTDLYPEVWVDHYLAIEFNAENRIKRFKLIEPYLFSNASKTLDDWKTQTDESESDKK